MRSLQSCGAHDLRHVNLPNLGNAVCLGQKHVAGLEIHVHHLGRNSLLVSEYVQPSIHIRHKVPYKATVNFPFFLLWVLQTAACVCLDQLKHDRTKTESGGHQILSSNMRLGKCDGLPHVSARSAAL